MASFGAERSSVEGELACDLLVLGAGPGGYSAAFRAADLGLNVLLVERYSTLGGVCLNVGCIPSKSLLHTAAAIDEATRLDDLGVHFGPPRIDLARLRAHTARVVERLTGGLAAMARARKVTVLEGSGRFRSPHQLCVEEPGASDGEGSRRTVRFRRAIVAAGSRALHLPCLPEDPRIVDSTRALELSSVPERMLLVGGGIIGLELGTVYSSLGARLDVVETQDRLMAGADRALVAAWQRFNAHRFGQIMLGTRVVEAWPTAEGVRVHFEGADAAKPQVYDRILQAVGRVPNGDQIGAEAAGLAVTETGFLAVDRQMRTNVAHVFAVGDVVGPPMLAHKAVHEGHVAAEVAAGELLGDDKLRRSELDARVIPSVAYTDPEIAWVGVTEDQARAEGRAVEKSVFPWGGLGRAIASGRSEGLTQLLLDPETRRIVGGGIVGAHAGDLIGELALAIEMGADEVDIGHTIHPHPTLGESICLAAAVARGACTDLPPSRSGRDSRSSSRA